MTPERLLAVLATDCQSLRDENTDQPTTKVTLPIKAWPFLRCGEPTVMNGKFRLFGTAKHAACHEVEYPSATREPVVE